MGGVNPEVMKNMGIDENFLSELENKIQSRRSIPPKKTQGI